MLLRRSKLTWVFALLSLPLCAQYGDQAASSPARWPNDVRVIVDPATAHPNPARTVPAELLRYPLSSKALHMLQKALQLSGTGDHAAAIKQLTKTLDKCPNTGAYVYSLLGVEYLKTGQLREAVMALEQAVAFLPHDASNHTNLGVALICEGRYERAEPELKRALDLDPRNTVASKLLDALALSRVALK